MVHFSTHARSADLGVKTWCEDCSVVNLFKGQMFFAEKVKLSCVQCWNSRSLRKVRARECVHDTSDFKRPQNFV